MATTTRTPTGADLVCMVCHQRGPGLDIDHIVNRGMGGSPARDVPENKAPLCRECHELKTKGYIKTWVEKVQYHEDDPITRNYWWRRKDADVAIRTPVQVSERYKCLVACDGAEREDVNASGQQRSAPSQAGEGEASKVPFSATAPRTPSPVLAAGGGSKAAEPYAVADGGSTGETAAGADGCGPLSAALMDAEGGGVRQRSDKPDMGQGSASTVRPRHQGQPCARASDGLDAQELRKGLAGETLGGDAAERQQLVAGSTPSASSLCQEGMHLLYWGLRIKGATDDWRWAVGDLILRMEEALNESAYQFLEPLKEAFGYDALRQYRMVAAGVTQVTRELAPTWSHARAVCTLPEKAQRAALLMARDESLSSRETALLVRPTPAERERHTCDCGNEHWLEVKGEWK